MYTIYDTVAEQGAPPFCALNDGIALRQVQKMLQEKAVKPDDYKLYRVGSWISSTMTVIAENPVIITDAKVADTEFRQELAKEKIKASKEKEARKV